MKTSSNLAVFEELALEIKQIVGYKLITFSIIINDGTQVERVYTNNAEVYPITGIKPILNDAWTDQVIGQGKTYLASTAQEMLPFFPDLETIKSLGLGSVINMPISIDNKVVGTVNILDAEGVYQAEDVVKMQTLLPKIINMLKFI
ncbi:hypothetical protein AwWohl_07100 [Gammaproteobacteria bacterium]|nr:hypothetical protein AwWohl_07100 [Gammaproteobacteria bacterium]